MIDFLDKFWLMARTHHFRFEKMIQKNYVVTKFVTLGSHLILLSLLETPTLLHEAHGVVRGAPESQPRYSQDR